MAGRWEALHNEGRGKGAGEVWGACPRGGPKNCSVKRRGPAPRRLHTAYISIPLSVRMRHTGRDGAAARGAMATGERGRPPLPPRGSWRLAAAALPQLLQCLQLQLHGRAGGGRCRGARARRTLALQELLGQDPLLQPLKLPLGGVGLFLSAEEAGGAGALGGAALAPATASARRQRHPGRGSVRPGRAPCAADNHPHA